MTEYTYKESYERDGNRLRVTLVRSDGLRAASQWWADSDGDAECDAWHRMRELEKKEPTNG